MEANFSIMSLHLRYRMWIAALNYDITVLRIFDDYLKELSSKQEISEVKTGISRFQEQFIDLRKEIDELRHEMHLLKMKLAAYSRGGKALDQDTYQADRHAALKKSYNSFRRKFTRAKAEFSEFEGKWLF